MIRFIPQGTVNNNPELDHLAGPKALDLNYYGLSTLSLHNLCLEVFVHGNELQLFCTMAFPLLIQLMSHI